MNLSRSLATALATLLLLVQPGASWAQKASTLDEVRARGTLNCGVSTGIAGFSMADGRGNWAGLDVDVCRAIAAAVLGDARKVRYRALSAQQRFAALQSGEVDVLSRNTTWTLSRDAALGLDFAAIAFHDGQGFMVPRTLGARGVRDLDGASICVQRGTTTEQVLAEHFRANRLRFAAVLVDTPREAGAAYFSGRCGAYTADVSALAALRAAQASNPSDHAILPEVISKEPQGPVVRQGDPRWTDVVRWSLFAMIEAEELGLSSRNIDEFVGSPNPAIQRFLGVQGGLGRMLGLEARWARDVVRQVGSYAEVYDRNIAPIGIERGLNRLWKDGGLLHAPPMR